MKILLYFEGEKALAKSGMGRACKLGKKVDCHAHSTADYLIKPTPYSKKLLENYGLRMPIAAISNGIVLSRRLSYTIILAMLNFQDTSKVM